MLIHAQRSAVIFAKPSSPEQETFWRSARIHPPELWQRVPEARSMPADQRAGMAIAPMPMSGDMSAHGPSAAATDSTAVHGAGFDGDAGRVLSCETADGGQTRQDRRP
jgi:hypothetical protein